MDTPPCTYQGRRDALHPRVGGTMDSTAALMAFIGTMPLQATAIEHGR
jgi:hypothetical protein